MRVQDHIIKRRTVTPSSNTRCYLGYPPRLSRHGESSKTQDNATFAMIPLLFDFVLCYSSTHHPDPTSTMAVHAENEPVQCTGPQSPSFQCPTTTTSCTVFANNDGEPVLCCPATQGCAIIDPLSCDVGAWNATAPTDSWGNAGVPSFLVLCGSACCPMGYACDNGRCDRTTAGQPASTGNPVSSFAAARATVIAQNSVSSLQTVGPSSSDTIPLAVTKSKENVPEAIVTRSTFSTSITSTSILQTTSTSTPDSPTGLQGPAGHHDIHLSTLSGVLIAIILFITISTGIGLGIWYLRLGRQRRDTSAKTRVRALNDEKAELDDAAKSWTRVPPTELAAHALIKELPGLPSRPHTLNSMPRELSSHFMQSSTGTRPASLGIDKELE